MEKIIAWLLAHPEYMTAIYYMHLLLAQLGAAGRLVRRDGPHPGAPSYYRLPAAREFAPGTIKKAFTGSGVAEKFMIGMECERRGWAPQNDDVADALAVLSCAANLPRSDELQAILKVAGQ
jgi:hypothetical protein